MQRRILNGSAAQVKGADDANAKVDAAVAEIKKQADDPPGLAVPAAFGRPITAKERATPTALLETQAKRCPGTPDGGARRRPTDVFEPKVIQTLLA